jgi:predicted NAD/FAD-dependent oxidoreductase
LDHHQHHPTTTTQLSAVARLYSSVSSNKPQPGQSNQINNSNNNNYNNKRKEDVAIIGGGIAGLSCAQTMALSGQFGRVTVFDTGRLRPGGRCSSRMMGDRPKEKENESCTSILSKHIVDHAAQILTVPRQQKGYEAFQQQVTEWEQQGIILPYPTGTVCEIRPDPAKKGFSLRPLNTKGAPAMYYGANGMGSIPVAMSKVPTMTMMSSGTGSGTSTGTFDIQQDVWVSPSNGVRYQRGATKNWKLQANGKPLGTFDRLVIAHNGKCADRLMSQTPAKELHSLLRVNFASSVPPSGGTKMTLNSIYSLTIAIPSRDRGGGGIDNSSPLSRVLPKDQFTCGFVLNEPALRFLSCQTRKYTKKTNTNTNNPNPLANKSNNNQNDDQVSTKKQDEDKGYDDDVEVWTILSSANFAKQYKAPQEFLPDDTVVNVTSLLLQAVERSLALATGSLSAPTKVLESRLQLWGAAVPLNVWSSMSTSATSTTTSNSQEPLANGGFLYDSEFGTGVCGDWLMEPSIAGAWESGRRLGQFMAQQRVDPPQSIGLPSSSSGIPTSRGQFVVSAKASKVGIGAL